MKSDHKAIVTTILHFPIERVWKALTDPKEMAAYMFGAVVTSDWKKGSTITWKGEWQGRPYKDTGRILSIREPRSLKYTHTSGADGTEHVVTIELNEVGGVTHLRLTQDNNRDELARQHSERNWEMMLDGLKKLLGEAPVETSRPLRR